MKGYLLTGMLFLLATLTACQTGTVQTRLLDQYESHEENCVSSVVQSPKYKKYLALHATNRQFYFVENQKTRHAYAVLAGDSIAALFMHHFRERYLPGVDIANRGIGGDTTELLLLLIEEVVLVLRPRVVIISISGNDLLQERCSDFVLQNVERILDRIQQKAPGTRVLVTSVPPVYEKRLNGIVIHYNQRLRNLVAKHKQASYIDLHSRLINTEGSRLAEQFWLHSPGGKVDRVHFNDAGYEVWAELLRPHLQAGR